MLFELNDALAELAADDSIGAVVLTGEGKAFAAGADIKEMGARDFPDTFKMDMLGHWSEVSKFRKPIIAAVNGYALGGGCELAMMCDIIIASEKAQFGQPEITLGTLPGAGGTQRLPRYIGKSRAMELILTGALMKADEAVTRGLASRAVPAERLLDDALETARKIASFSKPALMMCKEAVNQAYETSLKDGLLFEKRTFHSSFGLADRKEGMTAFSEKRKPEWRDS